MIYIIQYSTIIEREFHLWSTVGMNFNRASYDKAPRVCLSINEDIKINETPALQQYPRV